MAEFKFKIADICIKVIHRYNYVRELCKDYLCEDSETFTVSTTDAEIAAEKQLADFDLEDGYFECLCLYRSIAEKLPLYSRIVMHGATISYNGFSYIFTAPSGTGKSTHILKWKRLLGRRVGIVNGDKPVISVAVPQPTAYGTPWAGKERWQKNVSAPIGGICILKRGTVNSIRKLSPSECLSFILKQVYLPVDKTSAEKTLSIVDNILSVIPVYELTCDISEAAVKCSFEAMTGLNFEEEKKKNELQEK